MNQWNAFVQQRVVSALWYDGSNVGKSAQSRYLTGGYGGAETIEDRAVAATDREVHFLTNEVRDLLLLIPREGRSVHTAGPECRIEPDLTVKPTAGSQIWVRGGRSTLELNQDTDLGIGTDGAGVDDARCGATNQSAQGNQE